MYIIDGQLNNTENQINVQYTCAIHMYNTHVQYTCAIHMYNTHVQYTCINKQTHCKL